MWEENEMYIEKRDPLLEKHLYDEEHRYRKYKYKYRQYIYMEWAIQLCSC